MRLLLCGGGTAGHVNPAIAVAEELKSRDADAKILFIGRTGGQENELITASGYELKTVKVEGLKRSMSTDNVRRVITALKARSAAEQIIREFAPDVILGTGGYVCWPVISAGRRLGIPTAIHESNLTPGMTTKMLAAKCDRVFLNHEKTAEYLSQKTRCITVGNPLRSDFEHVDRRAARRKMGLRDDDIFLLSFGGSIGAECINKVMAEVMESYSSKTPKLRHLHATGKRYYRPEEKKYMGAGVGGCRMTPYVSNMPTAMTAADIVVSRCGAMTLSELSAAGVAAILIPSPNVTGDHQLKNAIYLKERGAAEVIEEKDLSAKRLIDSINSLIIDENGRKNRAKTINELFVPRAAEKLVNELFSINSKAKGAVL